MFLQYIFRLLVCSAVNGLETYLPVTSVLHAVSTVEQVCNLFPMSCPVAKVFLVQKVLQLILLMILSGSELYRKLEFQFGVLRFPLSCLQKTQISLQIFESRDFRGP